MKIKDAFEKLNNILGVEFSLAFMREFGYNQVDFLINNKEIDDDFIKKNLRLIKKIQQGYPFHYSLGHKFFYNLKILVNKHVLIPRNETELIIDEVKQYRGKVLDLCTGSGAIAIVLSKFSYEVCGTDISDKALKLARESANLNSANVKFFKSDMFSNIKDNFDIIVANPPYLSSNKINNKYEPHIALNGGKDGLSFYRNIAEEGWKFLNPNGVLILEIGYNQHQRVLKIFDKWKHIKTTHDYNGHRRILTFVKQNINLNDF